MTTRTNLSGQLNTSLIALLLVITASVVLVRITRNVDMKNLQVALEESQHSMLKHVSADTGKTLAVLIREAVALLIEQHEARKAARNNEEQ